MPRPASVSGGRDLPPHIHHAFAVRQLRALYHALPPQLQAETRARVLAILERERERHQAQPSALARLAPEVYGLRTISNKQNQKGTSHDQRSL